MLGILHVSTTQRAFCVSFKSLNALFNGIIIRLEFVKLPPVAYCVFVPVFILSPNIHIRQTVLYLILRSIQ